MMPVLPCIQYLLWPIHHTKATEVATGECHQYASYNVCNVIVDEHWPSSFLRAEVTQKENGDECCS